MRCKAAGFVTPLIIVLLLIGAIAATAARGQAPDILDLMRGIGEVSKGDRYAEAVPLGLSLVAETKRLAGDDHPMTAIAMFTLADLYRLAGRLDEAEPLLLRVLSIRERAFGGE